MLTDDKLGVIAGPDSGDTDNDGVLDVGEESICTKTTNLFATTTNIATVEGNDPTGALLDATSTAVTVKVTTNGVPEFPSLALPVGMILGFAFVAYTLGTTQKAETVKTLKGTISLFFSICQPPGERRFCIAFSTNNRGFQHSFFAVGFPQERYATNQGRAFVKVDNCPTSDGFHSSVQLSDLQLFRIESDESDTRSYL